MSATSPTPVTSVSVPSPLFPLTLDFDGEPVTLPPLEAQYEKKLADAYTICLAAVRNEDTSTGEWIYHSTQDEIEILTKKLAGTGVECSKGIGFIDFDPLTSLNYNSFKAPWPVSGRDFIGLGRTVILPPKDVPALNSNESKGIGALFTFITNSESPKMPPQKGLVRGVLHFLGFWVEAVPGNPNRSKVVYTLGSDPCGSIPKSIVNAMSVKQPLCISAIRNVLKTDTKLRSKLEEKMGSDTLKFREWRRNNGQGKPDTVTLADSKTVEVAASATPAVSEPASSSSA